MISRAVEDRTGEVPVLVTALAGGWLVISAASFVAWGHAAFWLLRAAGPLVLVTAAAYAGSWIVFRRLVQFPKASYAGMSLLVSAGAFTCALGLLAAIRSYYSLRFLLTAAATTALVLWVSSLSDVSRRFRALVIPGGRASEAARVLGISESDFQGGNQPPPWVLVDLAAPISEVLRIQMAEAAMRGARIVHAGAVLERVAGKISQSEARVAEVFAQRAGYEGLKRVIDVVLVLLSLPLTVPLAGLVAAAVWLDSPGPVIFVQERVGKNGRLFRMLKFRSMSICSRKSGPAFAAAEQARITRVGKFIRKFRLDELPQFLNVLRGEMSLIGPRPEQPGFVREFEASIPYYQLRHLVRPGISGWAQVSQGYASNADETREKLRHDLFYISHYSLWMDLIVVIRTIRTVITGFGAR
jgi:lipopolysaccharide/colanic/teichoic acid biosynthesis glycosyltransferase